MISNENNYLFRISSFTVNLHEIDYIYTFILHTVTNDLFGGLSNVNSVKECM